MFVWMLSQQLSLDTTLPSKLDIIMFEKRKKINPMGLIAPWDNNKTNNYSQSLKYNNLLTSCPTINTYIYSQI